MLKSFHDHSLDVCSITSTSRDLSLGFYRCRVFWVLRQTKLLKANSHIPCRSHVAPMPFSCHAVPERVLIVPFPFDLHRAAVFHSHMPCRVHAAPVPCHDHAVLKATSQGHGTARHGGGMGAAWAWHGMCELASTVQRRHVGDLPAFGFFRLPRGVPRSLLSEAYQSVKL
jgi:hypothetical protein